MSLRKVKDEIRSLISENTINQSDLHSIPVVYKLDYENFRLNYAEKSIPVIAKSFARNWSLTLGGLELFKKKYSENECKVRRGDYSTGIEGRSYFTEFITTVGKYISDIVNDRESTINTYAPYQIAQADIEELIEYPAWLPTEAVKQPVHYWLGPKNTYISIHSDTSDKLVYQAYGVKKWHLIAPHYSSKLYLYDDFGRGFDVSPINPNSPNREEYPYFNSCVMIEFTLSAGDIFFLPGGWYHSVSSLTPSLSFEYKSNPVPYSITDSKIKEKYLALISDIKAGRIT